MLTRISPEGFEIANAYLECGSVAETAKALAVPEHEVVKILNTSEIKSYLDGVYMDLGYRNRNKIGAVLDKMIESKLEEAEESGIYTSKDLFELIQFAHKMRMDEIKAEQKVDNSTNVQIAQFGDGAYGKLMERLIMAAKKTHAEYCQELIARNINAFPAEEYKGSNTKILHKCSEGHEWLAYPTNLLRLGTKGCPKCAKQGLKTHEQYEEDLFEKEIDYWPIEEYVNAYTPIEHECLKGHKWKIKPTHILNGHGCPKCNWSGFNPNKEAILYYIKISSDRQTYYKVGITNRTVKERFREEKDKVIKLLQETHFSNGFEALQAERAILQKYPRVSIPGFLKSGGHTELFDSDILNMDK